MNKLIFITGLILVGLNLNSQTIENYDLILKDSVYYKQGTIYTGKFYSTYKNGKIKQEGFIKNGKLDSIFTFYDKVGNPTVICKYINGKLNHKILFYPKTSIVKRKISLYNAIEDGLCISYYTNGLPQDSGNYAMGKKTGKWTYWNLKGQKNLEITIHEDCWERTDYIFSKDSIYSKTEFFDKFGRRMKNKNLKKL